MKKIIPFILSLAFLLGCATQKEATKPAEGIDYAVRYAEANQTLKHYLDQLVLFGDDWNKVKLANAAVWRQLPDEFDVVTVTRHLDTILSMIGERYAKASDAASIYITVYVQMKMAGDDLTVEQPYLFETFYNAQTAVNLWVEMLPEYQTYRQELFDLVDKYGL